MSSGLLPKLKVIDLANGVTLLFFCYGAEITSVKFVEVFSIQGLYERLSGLLG